MGFCHFGAFSSSRLIGGLLLLLFLGVSSIVQADDLNLEQYRGKVVLVDFWASWCLPCRQSFPWLNAMQAKYQDHLVIIAVNVDRDKADAERFLRAMPAGFAVIYDPDGLLAARYEVPGMPSSYVFGPDGALAARHIGFRSSARDERESELQKLLPSSDPSITRELKRRSR